MRRKKNIAKNASGNEKAVTPPYRVFLARYNSSTCFLAQGVFLKNFKLDLILGSLLKHRMSINLPSSAQP